MGKITNFSSLINVKFGKGIFPLANFSFIGTTCLSCGMENLCLEDRVNEIPAGNNRNNKRRHTLTRYNLNVINIYKFRHYLFVIFSVAGIRTHNLTHAVENSNHSAISTPSVSSQLRAGYLSVRSSVRHMRVLSQDKGTQEHPAISIFNCILSAQSRSSSVSAVSVCM